MHSTLRRWIACASLALGAFCQPAGAADAPILTVPNANDELRGTRCYLGNYAFDSSGYLYYHAYEVPSTYPSESLTRFGAGRIKKLSPTGAVSVVSEEVLPCGFDMALDGVGHLYLMRVYDYAFVPFNGTLKMSLATGAITTVSSATGFNVTLDAIGNIYYNPKANTAEIRKITADGASTVIVTGLRPMYPDCLESAGCIYFTRDSNGNLFTLERTLETLIADSDPSHSASMYVDTIKKFGPAGGDGASPQMSWAKSPTGGAYRAQGLAADGAGNIFFVQIEPKAAYDPVRNTTGVVYAGARLVKIDPQNVMSVVLTLSEGTFEISRDSFGRPFSQGYALNTVGADGNFYATKTSLLPGTFVPPCPVGVCVQRSLVRIGSASTVPSPGAASIQVTQTGSRENLTLRGSITVPPPRGSCATPKIWVAAVVPPADYFFLTPAGWQRMEGALPHYASGTGPFTVSLAESANLSGLEGTAIYLAYGCTQEEMLTRGMYSPIHTVP